MQAPVERVFDLSRSINLHRITAAHTNGVLVPGTISGLIDINESVTWQAKHLFSIWRFTAKITTMERPVMFTAEMTEGDFASFKHEHYFKPVQNGTLMIDEVAYEMSYGQVEDHLPVSTSTVTSKKLLAKTNQGIRDHAESQKWKLIIN